MQIQQINPNITFEGLSTQLAKRVYDNGEVFKLVNKYPKSNGIVGSLPNDWVNKIPKNERKSAIKDIYENLGEIFQTALFQPYTGMVKSMQFRVSELLKRHKIIPLDKSVEMFQYRSGSYGHAFSIFDGTNKYCMKVFKDKKYSYPDSLKKNLIEKDYLKCTTHGNGIEQNILWFINKNSPKDGDWNKMYYGDIKNGLMLSKAINYVDQPEPKKHTDLFKIGLNYNDGHSLNIISGYYVDPGGMVVYPPAKDKTTRYIFKKMAAMNSDNEAYKFAVGVIKNKKVPQYEDKLVGLAHSIKLIDSELTKEIIYDSLLTKNIKKVNDAIGQNIHYFDSKYRAILRTKLGLTGAENPFHTKANRSIHFVPSSS